jgi:peptide/nickel transport system substrate-binding protein
MKRNFKFLLAALLVVGLLLGACSTPAPTPATTSPPGITASPKPVVVPSTTPTPSAIQPQYGGIFKLGSPAVPKSLVPWDNNADGRYLKANFDTLLRVDENGQLQPWLATEWKLSSDSKTFTLTLRKNVKFHDGTDFNAAAAKWNIDLRKSMKMGDWDMVSSVDVVDDYTIRLNLSSFSNTLYVTLWYIGSMMSSPTAYEKYGKEQAVWNPVGTGPFKFVSYQKDQVIKYERMAMNVIL